MLPGLLLRQVNRAESTRRGGGTPDLAAGPTADRGGAQVARAVYGGLKR
jgi:hypothetical protein